MKVTGILVLKLVGVAVASVPLLATAVVVVRHYSMTPEERAADADRREMRRAEAKLVDDYSRQKAKADAIADDLIARGMVDLRVMDRDSVRRSALDTVRMCESEALSVAERSRVCSPREMAK